MPKKKRYKIKDLILPNFNGEMTNYGKLVMGDLNGVKCLAHREVLMLLGIKLVLDVKPPKYFFTHLQIIVSAGGLPVTLYAMHPQTFDALGSRLSKRGYNPKGIAQHLGDAVVKRWEHGELTYDAWEIPKVEGRHIKTHYTDEWAEFRKDVKRNKPLYKFWLLLKRLFGKGESVQ